MLDKQKLAALIVIGVLVVAGLAVSITLGLSGQHHSDAGPSQAPAPPSAATTDAPPEPVELTTEEMNALKAAGEAAASFDNNPKSALGAEDYIKAGFTESLAKSYKPIWGGVFAGRADQATARIDAQVGGPVGGAGVLQQSLKVLDYTGSKPGNYVIRAAVTVRWKTWDVTAGRGKDGLPVPVNANGEAVWTLTYEQLSQRILKVEQPAWQDLGAEKLFEGLGLPVPTKGANTAAQAGT
ncbi:hypothetical protein ACFUOZ_19605 [Paenarthrobacter sp. NPDC057355]|uniref:hypothetical protein n=1 Tax=Paenarthrobacter sp. NPDC057355 TaxID=3346105 RepID=UPI003638A672